MLEDLCSISEFDQHAFIEAHQQAAVTSIRLNPKKKFLDDELSSETIPWCENGRILPKRPVFTLDPVYHAGGYYVQEASSMFLDYLLGQLLPSRSSLRVLDLCAAPGGKSTLLSSFFDTDTLIISNEVIRTRASILEENVVRWGFANNWVTCNDAKQFSALTGYFDVIVVDAPCSGSGLFRKDKAALEEWSEANVTLCCARQKRIVADIWPALKTGGILIYATCSYSTQEDEAILDWAGESFDVSTLQVNVPENWGIIETCSSKGHYGYRFLPDRLKGEGFFIAALQKEDLQKALTFPKFKSADNKKFHSIGANFLNLTEKDLILQHKDTFVCFQNQHEVDYNLLKKHLYIRRVGTALGTPTGKDWLPAHDIAFSIARSESLPNMELSKIDALHFLKKEEISIIPSQKGWLLITFQGLGLGWIKSLGNRINNYLPKHWRIRMDISEF